VSVARGKSRIVRRDPTPELDEELVADDFAWINGRPDMAYAWANKGDGHAGTVGDYECRGYSVATYEDGGVRPRMVSARHIVVGNEITRGGMVLMQIPKAEREAAEAKAQARLDLLDRRMLGRRGAMDGTYLATAISESAGNPQYVNYAVHDE